MAAFTRCTGCKAHIYWTVTRSGKRMPVDRHPHPEGNVMIWEDAGVLRSRVLGLAEAAREAEDLRLAHFATCKSPPKAAKMAKAKRRARRR